MLPVRVAIAVAAFTVVLRACIPETVSLSIPPKEVEFKACTAEAILLVSDTSLSNPDDTFIFCNLKLSALMLAIKHLHM